MIGGPLAAADTEELEAAFAAARKDYEKLKAIADELQHRGTARARILRLKVIGAMASAKREQGPAIGQEAPGSRAQQAASRAPLNTLLAGFGLQAPDGRPLHRYRLGAERYSELFADLKARAAAGGLGNATGEDGPLFVLWASAWFRREYRGGARNYADLESVLGISHPQAHWRQLIEAGLKWWRRPVIERASGRHRLLTIAVEGGFPIRVLEEKGDGWLSRYLNEVVGRLLGLEEPGPEEALAFATAASEALLDTYRQEAFMALAADLALGIVRLRREAESAAPGLTPSIVLDQIKPGWRDDLPIASDTGAARALVDGMLATAKILRGLSGSAGCVRVLRRRGTEWLTGLRLSLSGEIPAAMLEGLAEPGIRLGLHPHGALARAVREELAFLDPPGEDGTTWRLRQLTRRTEIEGVPLGARVEVQIQAPNGGARSILWPGGEPQRSDVVIFEIDAEEDGRPSSLVLAAHGSARLRASRVAVAAPADWSVSWSEPGGSEVPEVLGTVDDGRKLWLANASILVTSSDGSFVYSIEPGADEELRDRIVLEGETPREFEGADDVPLFAGPPSVRCRRGRIPVHPAADELLWRCGRGEPWRELARHRLPSGTVDIMWRDNRTRFVRDRVRTAIVPPSARVARERHGEGWCYRFLGMAEFEVEPEAGEGLHIEYGQDCSFSLSFKRLPRRHVTFLLSVAGDARAIRICLPFPLREGLAHWDGRLVPPQSVLTPAQLGELVAFGEGKLKLCAVLKRAEMDVPPLNLLGERELGLRPLAARIASDLASGGIDTWVELSFLGGSGDHYRIQPFDSELNLSADAAMVRNVSGLADAPLALAGRSVSSPDKEWRLAELVSEDVLERRAILLPPDVRGPWWLYLRSGRIVRSRPSILLRGSSKPSPANSLAAAATIAEASERRDAIARQLALIPDAGEGGAEDLAWLRRLIVSLDGVPAGTFDALAALPNSPSTLALLLLTAGDETVQADTWRLESELPFLWSALPLTAWHVAAQSLGRMTIEPLVGNGWEMSAAAQIGRDSVSAAVARTASLDPAIAAVLAAADLLPTPDEPPTILDAASGYVRRTYDRGETGMPKLSSLFRTESLSPFLPDWFETRFNRIHLEALDAPIAAAAAARGEIELTPAQLRRCKAAVAEDPIYFAEGLTAALLGSAE